MNSIPTIIQMLFCLILVAAAISDGRTFRIPNIVTLALLLLFPAAWALGYPFTAPLWSHGAHFAIALAVGMLLFRFDMFGAGDAKLYAATALWFGLGDSIRLMLFVALSGGLLVLIRMIMGVTGIFGGSGSGGVTADGQYKSMSARLLERRIAYGIAIALGGILCLMMPKFANL